MLLADLVATSAAVKAVSGRLDKIGRLAALLQGLSGDEGCDHTGDLPDR